MAKGLDRAASWQWVPIPGYEGLYEISSWSHVRSLPRPGTRTRILRVSRTTGGYKKVRLFKNSIGRTFELHVLMAKAFFGPRPDGKHVRHLDGRRLNCTIWNLAYGTPGENSQDQIYHGVHYWAKRTKCSNGHEYTAANTQINPSHPTWRECKKCHAYREKNRSPRRVRRVSSK